MELGIISVIILRARTQQTFYFIPKFSKILMDEGIKDKKSSAGENCGVSL